MKEKLMVAGAILAAFMLGMYAQYDGSTQAAAPPAAQPPIVVQTENPEVIKVLAELTKQFARMNTEREAIASGEKPGNEPGTLMLIDSQTGVPFQTDEKRMVRIIGGEYEIITYYKDGKYINIPALYGAENIPPPRPPSMEIYNGGQRTDTTFPSPEIRRSQPRESGE